MLLFKEFILEQEKRLSSPLHPDVMSHIDDFVKWGNSKNGEDHFGAPLNVLHSEPGSCAMVAGDLTSHLKKKGIDAKTITGSSPTNRKWNEVKDAEGFGGQHTVTRVGDHVIDLTRGQFDPNSKKIHVHHIDDFKKEWNHVD